MTQETMPDGTLWHPHYDNAAAFFNFTAVRYKGGVYGVSWDTYGAGSGAGTISVDKDTGKFHGTARNGIDITPSDTITEALERVVRAYFAPKPEPAPASSITFSLVDADDPTQHPHHVVIRRLFDGTTTDELEIGRIHLDPHRQQYRALTEYGWTRYVSEYRIAFEDVVANWVTHNSPAVQAVYKAAASAWHILEAEEKREAERNEERKAHGERPSLRTRRNLVKAQYGWNTSLRILGHVLTAIGEDVGGYGGVSDPSGDLTMPFLRRWMEHNPNG